jgi:hypothetical protein
MLRILALLAVLAACAVDRAAAQQPSPLVLALTLDQTVIEPGTPVSFTLRVTNNSGAPFTAIFPSSQRFEVVLRSREGGELSRWSTGQSFTQGINEVRWTAGEVKSFTGSWIPLSMTLPGLSIAPQLISRGYLEATAHLPALGIRAQSEPQPVIIGPSISLAAGCTTLADTPTTDVPFGAVVRTIQPTRALISLWQQTTLANGAVVFASYSPGLAPASNLTTLRPGAPVTVCLREPGRIVLP